VCLNKFSAGNRARTPIVSARPRRSLCHAFRSLVLCIIVHESSITEMSTDSQNRVVPPSRRRDKVIVSCTLCRRRKLKCDRQQPCKTCVDRGLALSCTYVRNTPARQEPKAPHSVHDRIDQLEKLVTTLMSGKEVGRGSSTALPTPHPQHLSEENNTAIPNTPDRVRFNGDTTSYTNSAHWTSILDGVRSS
jgi:Fungal Zn(2)-Cys(6) binuclear cluster domain